MRPAAIVLCLFLGACANAQQLAADRAAKQAALDTSDDNTCRSWGAEKGTEAYFNCRMTLNTQRANTAIAQQQISAQQSSASMNTAAALIAASGPHN
jgi:hypothetical protein